MTRWSRRSQTCTSPSANTRLARWSLAVPNRRSVVAARATVRDVRSTSNIVAYRQATRLWLPVTPLGAIHLGFPLPDELGQSVGSGCSAGRLEMRAASLLRHWQYEGSPRTSRTAAAISSALALSPSRARPAPSDSTDVRSRVDLQPGWQAHERDG